MMKKVERIKSFILRQGAQMRRLAVCLFTVAVVLYALIFLPCGCAQPGETAAEGHRRHIRNARINQQEMMRDIDSVMLFDTPSKLTDRRVP